ncbi:MAG: UDP-N-acetylglucosamine 2-epimerase (non-hydrolyzing) [Pseudomonadota bacterium]
MRNASESAHNKRVMLVFGTRPEAIKMLPVVQELRKRPDVEPVVVVTGQHREMLQQVFDMFDEKPDLDLALMTHKQSLSEIAARMLTATAQCIDEVRPAIVLVHGDTTTALSAASAAFYARVPIGHVEAGLRSHDFNKPWPEEFNRVGVDLLSTLLFAPTETSAQNLQQEPNCRGEVHVTGNTGIDALLSVAAALERDADRRAAVALQLPKLNPHKKLVVVTGHRRESFGQGFEEICQGLTMIGQRRDVEVVYPVHLNPAVRSVVLERLAGQSNIHLIDPVNYAEMVYLMNAAHVLLTDSGGIQEEGPALGKPVLVMRDVTERPEALATGVAQLVGTNPDTMSARVHQLLDDREEYARRSRAVFPYGRGDASVKIASIISEWTGR